jgi:hypothetical protein
VGRRSSGFSPSSPPRAAPLTFTLGVVVTRPAMQASREQRDEISRVLEVSLKFAPVCLAVSIVSVIWFFNISMLIAAGSYLLAGLAAFGGLLLSWRHYRYGVSLGVWLMFVTIVTAAPSLLLVLPSVRAGQLHPLAALFAFFGCLGIGISGPLALIPQRIRTWFGA